MSVSFNERRVKIQISTEFLAQTLQFELDKFFCMSDCSSQNGYGIILLIAIHQPLSYGNDKIVQSGKTKVSHT
jgi:hypothetical protein